MQIKTRNYIIYTRQLYNTICLQGNYYCNVCLNYSWLEYILIDSKTYFEVTIMYGTVSLCVCDYGISTFQIYTEMFPRWFNIILTTATGL